MNKLKAITLYEKRGAKVVPYHFKKKRRFFSLYRACSFGRIDVLLKLKVSYGLKGYGKDPKNVSCWGDKDYIKDCFYQFTDL